MRGLYLKLAKREGAVKGCLGGGFPVPESVTIFPSERCNLRCVYCHSVGIHGGGLMPAGDFYVLIKDLFDFGVKNVAFEGGGEPLLHPALGAFIRYCKLLGMGVGVITNGTVYIPELRLCDWVRVSLDVPDREVFKAIKGKDVYEGVIKNIKKIKGPDVGIKFMLSKLWTDAKACEGLAKELGVYCQIKDVRNHDLSLKGAVAGEKCRLTPLRAVVDYDGTFYACPFFHHQDLKIGGGKIKDVWGSKKHREVVGRIDPEKCALYDCPFRDVDLTVLKEAHLGWI